jgi:RNA polymerase sigma-70 factor (ECF subfamily)
LHEDYDDTELITGLRSDDEAAFAQLIERYRQPVFRMLVRRLGNEQDAEDALTEVFCRVWRTRHTFRGDCSLFAWLCTAVTWAASDVREKRDRHHKSRVAFDLVEQGALAPAAPARDEPEHRIARDEAAAQVREAIAQLPAKYQTVISLHYLEGMSYQEVAAHTGIQPTALKSLLHRAVTKLRAKLAPFVETNDETPAAAAAEPPETSTKRPVAALRCRRPDLSRRVL